MTGRSAMLVGALTVLVVLLSGAIVAVADDNDENEQKTTMDQLPAAVKTAVQKEVGATQPDEIEKQTTKAGKTTYEVEWHTAAVRSEATFADDGKLLHKTTVTPPEKVAVEKLPELVRKALAAEIGNAEVKTVIKIVRNDKAFYTAEWKLDGKEAEVVLAEGGKVVVKEQEVAVDALPDAVKATLKKELGDNTATEAACVTRGEKKSYKVEWKADGKQVEAVFAADGKFLGKETGDDDDSNDEDDDD